MKKLIKRRIESSIQIKELILKDDDLLNQIENPVNWVEIIKNMDNNGANLYIEVGPGNILEGLNKRISKNKTINFNEI